VKNQQTMPDVRLMSEHPCLLKLAVKKTPGKQKGQKRARRAKSLFALLARVCPFCFPLPVTPSRLFLKAS
jgi:hypothetical protein